MDKIDLDAIMQEVDPSGNDIWANEEEWGIIREFAKKAIQKALVLASEKASARSYSKFDESGCWTVTEVDKQSILDVEKLIV